MGYTDKYANVEPTRADIDQIAGPLVVEFGAPWCPHCIDRQPILAELLEQSPEVQHIKIYDGKGQPLGRSFRVKLWPTLVFMRDGQVIHQVSRPAVEEVQAGLEAIQGSSPS